MLEEPIKSDLSEEFQENCELMEAFLAAAKNGDIGEIERQFNEAKDKNAKDNLILITNEKKKTALHLAAEHGKLDVVKYLIEQGADVNTPDKNSEGRDNLIPLHYAARNGYKDVVLTLLASNSDINAPDRSGITPLQHAAKAGEFDVVALLIEQNADINVADKNGMTAVSWAAKAGHEAIVATLNNTNEMTQVNINVSDKNDMTPLQHSAKAHSWNVLKYLIEKGADINVVDINGTTPISRIAKACKWDMVKYMVERGAKVKNLTYDQKVCLLKHVASSNLKIDQDTDNKVRKALHATICLNNVDLFETLMRKWQSDYSNNPDIFQAPDNLLPKVYEELRLKDVPLSKKMEWCVEAKLIQSRFFIDKNVQTQWDVKASFQDVKERIEVVLDCINDLKQEYSSKKDIDTKFLFIGRFIAHNIHILKRQLRSTYDKLPWEEMEFYLVNFLSSSLKQQDPDIIYKLVLHKEKVLKYLGYFGQKITEVAVNLQTTDINSKFPKLLARNEAYQSVVSMWKLPCGEFLFQELYDDFDMIKDVYFLKRIETYIKLALSIDLDQKQEIGKLVIERTLQVIGECLKNSLESPNISNDIHRVLFCSAPSNLREIITSLRNSLSHAHTLTKKMALEDNKDPEFFHNVQNDLKKIAVEISDILYKKKVTAIRMYVNKIINSKDLAEVKKLNKSVNSADLGEMKFINCNTKELKKVQVMIDELSDKIRDQTEEEKKLFNEIKRIIDSQGNSRAMDVKIKYITGYLDINSLISEINHINNLETVQNISRTYLDGIRPEIQPDIILKILRDIVRLLQNIVNSVKLRVEHNALGEINILMDNIFAAIEFDAGRIKAIDEFKITLEKKESNPQNYVQEKVESILSDIEQRIGKEQDREIFRKGLENKKQLYEAKLGLSTLFAELNEGIALKDDPLIKQKYEDLVEKLGIAKAKKNLNKEFGNSEWNECKTLVHKLRSSYQTLLDSVKNSTENKISYDVAKCFKEFNKSIINAKNQALLNELTIIIDNILLENEKQLQNYFDKRLIVLKQLFLSNNVQFNCVEKITQDEKLQAAVEMLCLDLTEVLENIPLFADNRLFFDTYSPILIGKSLRNYLAHGDSLIDIFPFDPSIAIFSSAFKFVKEGRDIVIKQNILIGNQIVTNLADLKYRYTQSMELIINQNEMFIAAKQGNLEEVKICINKGADVKARDINGWTGLHFASAGDSVEVLTFFLDQNVSIAVENNYGQNAIHIAAISGSINIIKYFIGEKKLNVNNRVCKGRTLLHLAATTGHKEVVKALLDQGASVDVLDNDNMTPLHLAARGHKEVVEVLVEKGANVDALTIDNLTSLHYAAQEGHHDVIEVLLNKQANADVLHYIFGTPLHVAAGAGHKEAVKMLLSNGVMVNSLGMDNRTPLHGAAHGNHKEVVVALLDKKANVNAETKTNWTPLHTAAIVGAREVVDTLLEKGAMVNATIAENWTALHLAAYGGHKEIVDVLLNQQANVNATDKVIGTPLHMAAVTGHYEVVEVLLNKEASVDALCKGDLTPLHVAAFSGQKQVVKALLNNKANINATDTGIRTPLHMAVENGHRDVVEALVSNGAEVNAVSKKSWTPLHVAAFGGYMEVVRTLLKKNANVNATDKVSRTPLHLAVEKGHKDVVEALLENKAKVDSFTKGNLTPLHWAARVGHKEIVNALLLNGAKVDVLCTGNMTPLHLAAFGGHKEVVRALLNNKANLDATDMATGTALHGAATAGHREVVETLLEKGAKVDALNNDKRTALFVAAQNGHTDVIEVLLDKNADVDAPDKDNCTPLHGAAKYGHEKVVGVLLKGNANVDVFDKDNWTPLHDAAKNGHKEILEMLFKKKAKVNATTKDKVTPLHLAAGLGHKIVAEALIGKGAMVDAVTEDKVTPLHLAAENGHHNVVEILLDKRADINALFKNFWTPLHLAARNSHKAVVETLLKKGAKVNALGEDNKTPLHLAAETTHKEVVEVLLENKAMVNACDKDNRTPLHLAAKNGCKEVVEALLLARATVDVLDTGKCTPLHLAAKNGCKEVVEALLEKGSMVNACDMKKWTPLHIAAFGGHEQVVDVLLNKNANVNATDKLTSTPLHVAALEGHLAVVETLLKKGAKVDALGQDNITPLHLALLGGHNEVFQTLLNHGADFVA